MIRVLGPDLARHFHIIIDTRPGGPEADGLDEFRGKVIWHLRRAVQHTLKDDRTKRQALDVYFNITPFPVLRSMKKIDDRAKWFQEQHGGPSRKTIGDYTSLDPNLPTLLPTLAQELCKRQPIPPEEQIEAILAEIRGQAPLPQEGRPAEEEVAYAPVETPADVSALRQVDHLLQATEQVATAIRYELQAEERARKLQDPFPLPLRWHNAPEDITDHWSNICLDTRRNQPVDLSGSLDDVVTLWNKVPSGRLVILGKPGAGKTVLAIQIAQGTLDPKHRQAGAPVPVIFNLSSWNPEKTTLRAWMAKRLQEDHLSIRRLLTAGRPKMATQLLAAGRVLPILDGFDEMAPGLQLHALRAINASFSHGEKFVVVSRQEEYTIAVASSDVITGAAVISISDLDVNDLIAYLPKTARRTETADATTKWDDVLVQVRATPSSPVVMALSTPLMASLARAIYSETSRDPREILEARFEDGVSLGDHLMDQLLIAAYEPGPQDQAIESKHRYGLENARRWLQFLAVDMYICNVSSLSWFSLAFSLTGLFLTCLVSFAVISLGWGIGASLLFDGWPVLVIGGGAGILGSAIVISALFEGSKKYSRFTRKRFRIIAAFRWTIVVAAFMFIALSLSDWLIFGEPQIRTNVLIGGVMGVLAGVGVELANMVEVSLVPEREVDPRTAIKEARTAMLVDILYFGTGCFVLVLVLNYTVRSAGMSLATSVILSAVFIVMSMAFASLTSPWLSYKLAHLWLALRGRLPWRLMRFLADAHGRGVLRQSGGSYQFRHALLRDRIILSQPLHRPSRSSQRADFRHVSASLSCKRGTQLLIAENEYRQLRDDWRNASGRAFARCIAAWRNYSVLLLARGRPGLAEAELRQALMECRQRFGDDQMTHALLETLAEMLHASGSVTESHAVYESLQDALAITYGKEHSRAASIHACDLNDAPLDRVEAQRSVVERLLSRPIWYARHGVRVS